MRFVSLAVTMSSLSALVLAVAPPTAAYAQDKEDDAHCPYCGAGWVNYYDWACDGKDYVLEVVGTRTYGECDGVGELDGRETACVESIRSIGGGGDDVGRCFFVECDLPRPEGSCVADPIDVPPDEVEDPPPPKDPSGGGAEPPPDEVEDPPPPPKDPSGGGAEPPPPFVR